MQSMHLDEEQVQRLLHHELAPGEGEGRETSVREHLGWCAECRGRVAAAEREENDVFALLRQLDHPPPRVEAQSVAARARARGVSWSRWAAGIVLALGLAGAAYAAPGSPLPAWVRAVVNWIGDRPDSGAPASAQAPVPGPGVGGIAVAPGRELVILFTAPQVEGQARVSLTDGADVVVRAPSGAATFTSDVNRLVIDNTGEASSATFEIEIPRAAPRVEIRVEAVRLFLKDGPRITAAAGSTELRGSYLLGLTPAAP